MTTEHAVEAQFRSGENEREMLLDRIDALEAVLLKVRKRWKFTMNVLDDGLQIEMDQLLASTSAKGKEGKA